MKALNFADFKKIHRMSLNEFNRWLEVFYRHAYADGVEACKKNSGVVAEVSDQDLMSILLSIKGIGEKRADQALSAILSTGRCQHESET